eukprot:4925925-Pyramimonas_sp.AAC.1
MGPATCDRPHPAAHRLDGGDDADTELASSGGRDSSEEPRRSASRSGGSRGARRAARARPSSHGTAGPAPEPPRRARRAGRTRGSGWDVPPSP